jgi:biopolymer transport protein ExbD
MAISSRSLANQPMSEMNTTPLIDVMLVLLIMFIITIPVATHVTPIDVGADPSHSPQLVDPVVNRVVVTADDRILWNGEGVSERDLSALLAQSLRMPVEPELQFQPDAQASYDIAAKVTGRIKQSGVTKFGVVGNERYSEFRKGPDAP